MEFRLRPLPPAEKGWQKAARVFVSRESLKELTADVVDGKRCVIESVSNSQMRREATLYLAKGREPLAKSVLQMHDSFRALGGWSYSETVRVTVDQAASEVPVAQCIVVEDITKSHQSQDISTITVDNLIFWKASVADVLCRGVNIFPGMVIPDVHARGEDRTFRVLSLDGHLSNIRRVLLETSRIEIIQDDATANKKQSPRPRIELLAGLEKQCTQLNKFLRAFGRKFRFPQERRSCAVLLEGGPGTGKTMVVEQLCSSGWGTVHRIQPRDKLSSIQATLQKAQIEQPSIIVIDNLQQLIRNDRDNRGAVIGCIGDFLDQLSRQSLEKGEHPLVIVVATCLDCVMDLPTELRDTKRFGWRIFFPIPDAARRQVILASFSLPFMPEERDRILSDLARRTHAYNGSDLDNLACTIRLLLSFEPDDEPEEQTEPVYASTEIIASALEMIGPSSMNDVSLKPPAVHFEDIAGQAKLKEELRFVVAISTALREPGSRFTNLLPKGYLLYGPPGCSKTMAAQAMATESDLSFFSVKGPELLNMYVGETERAIRAIFSRARLNAPSIIFFDEIDTLASSRESGSPGKGSSGGGHHVGISAMATLLTEMDGFESNPEVMVLAATNRPEAMDPALLRAGRFKNTIFVGPPDAEARQSIITRFLHSNEHDASVDIESLVNLSDGFSGAEVVNACQSAGETAFREALRETWGDGANHSQVSFESLRPIRQDDLVRAFKAQISVITPEMLKGYHDWAVKATMM